MACIVDHGEQQIPNFLLHIGRRGGRFDLGQFFGNLVPRPRYIGPIETDPGSSFLYLLRAKESGKGARNSVQRATGSALRRLDLLPTTFHRYRISGTVSGKNMRVAPDHFFANGLDHIADGESTLFLRDPRVKHNLEQKVAQFRL